jgi:translation initiation factor 3 subunit L
MLADYRSALRVLDTVDIDDQRALFMQVKPSAVTLFSNLGFTYMMSKRYADALQIFTRVLTSHRPGAREHSASFAEEMIVARQQDKILALAAMCHVLSPGVRLDEQVRRGVSDKYENLINLVNARNVGNEDVNAFKEIFTSMSPRFVNPATPAFLLPRTEGSAPNAKLPSQEEISKARRDIAEIQTRIFLDGVRQQLAHPAVRAHLKLYKSLPIEKLSRFCQVNVDQLRQDLIFIKARSSQTVRGISDGSAPIEGTRTTVSEVNFYILGDKDPVNDMIFIVSDAPNSRQQSSAKSFAFNSLKFQNVISDLNKEVAPAKEIGEDD